MGHHQFPRLIDLATKHKWRKIDLRSKGIKEIPREIGELENLRYLDLSYNNLASLPPEISNLKKLRYLDLRENPKLPISPEILNDPSDPVRILNFISRLEEEGKGQRLNEAKMLVVGDGKVGKTSIVKRLVYNTFDPEQKTTVGVDIKDEIEIKEWRVHGASDTIKLNIWDFGGQEIQHSTHQFFLTTRSLYLLVLDARKGDQINTVEYWLKMIRSFGGNSPIIILINQIDQLEGQRPLNLDRRALQNKYNIKDFVEASCLTGVGISKLREIIAKETDKLDHVHDILPKKWFEVKNRLKKMPQDYITLEKYHEICEEEKISDDYTRNSLLNLLHELGTVISFPGDTHVLNPRWVTQGVYGLLTAHEIVQAQGRFNIKNVGNILNSNPLTNGRYPTHTHRKIIEIMKRFELCFEFYGLEGDYLIPRHLYDNELDIPWTESDSIRMEYHYDTLPDVIISRFIVRMNQYIQNQYYWKNGVFLHNRENRAKIKSDLVDRKIFISVIGKEQTRRSFLAIIRSAFNDIHSSYREIGIKQMVPVPEHPKILVSYDDLIAHEDLNEEIIIIPELRQKMPVRKFLDGIETPQERLEYKNRSRNERYLGRRMESKIEKSKPIQPFTHERPVKRVWSIGVFFLSASVILLAAFVGAAIVLSKYVSLTSAIILSFVFVATLLGIGLFAFIVLVAVDVISQETFSNLIKIIYERLPLLRKEKHHEDIEGKHQSK